jgi:hypothetical protein
MLQRNVGDSLMPDLEHAIRERAYYLWTADGQPEGNADVYWLAAQREILATSLDSTETAGPSMHVCIPNWPRQKLSKSQGALDLEKANLAPHSHLLISRQLALSPTMVFAAGIKQALDVPV